MTGTHTVLSDGLPTSLDQDYKTTKLTEILNNGNDPVNVGIDSYVDGRLSLIAVIRKRSNSDHIVHVILGHIHQGTAAVSTYSFREFQPVTIESD